MVRDDHTWQGTTAQFYAQLYTCAWQTLVPFLGAATAYELLILSSQACLDAYPFLAHLRWTTEGLDPASLGAAITAEERAHVEAGFEQLLQRLQTLTQDIGGALLAQRLRAMTEQLRLTFEPALSRPMAPKEVEHLATPAHPQEAALPLLQSMAQQALLLYRRAQAHSTSSPPPSVLERPAHAPAVAATTPPPHLVAPMDLTRSEAFYHTLFDLSPDGVLVVDSHGILVQVNSRAAEILEFDSPQDLIGLPAVDFYVHPEHRAALLEQITQHARVEGRRGELRTHRGRTIIITASSRLIDYEGQPCVLSVIRDVTDRARLQQEMEDFAYSASHDLQAPLRTFEGYARWLLEDYGAALDSAGRQLCEEIIDDALHMKKLLDGLLEYSRIGRLHTQAVEVEVRAVLERVLHDLQLEIADTRAHIRVPASLPTVRYPEVRLTQIFTNLLSNALKFIAPGTTPEIVIACAEQPRSYRFSVHDNGIGIAPGHYGRIFEIFKRLHTREEYPGTGAGLTIVKKIVESHGGQIGVESVPGEGSTFWFTIPKTEALSCAS
ncbi:MAG: PAS domain S-box protein [Candidatus Tectomicrobia bacterium]|uniref:histidine kinase n=1 Tax=Tectimicrobiota bacterium TaxID=2528274 RepID=A0A937W096_UNCTE|nr:PAS domain S-box protein [Candidatus Tectomicrobia bacterium]